MSRNKNSINAVNQITIDMNRFNVEPNYECLPIVTTRDFVMFPGVTFPISLGRESSKATMTEAFNRSIPIGIVCQIDPNIETPTKPEDVCEYGVVADVLQIIDLPDGSKTAIVHARDKFRLLAFVPNNAGDIHGALTAYTTPVKESHARPSDKEFHALIAAIKDTMLNILRHSENTPEDIKFNIENTEQADTLINIIATHAPFSTRFKMELLAQHRLKDRAFMILIELSKNERMVEIDNEIRNRTLARIDENQRNMFLQQKLEAIREELYGEIDDAETFKKRGAEVAFTPEVRQTFNKEVEKLGRLHPQSPEYAVQYSYIELLLDLPWGKYDTPADDIDAAEKTLNDDHFGLEKVKERVLEQIAVIMNNPDGRSPIVCLVGAPGVGKTSMGQSIARAMNRKFQRVSLGGMHDESEIRGHRRTYIGAMPGRIIEALRRSGSANPVLLLDEIDKLGRDYKGDPSSALLEVLDPEQNCHFHDNYVDVDFDLSKVLFIATANTLSTVPQPLLDRMEIIDISGYLIEEKVEIARRFLIPRILKENALANDVVAIPDETIVAIIEQYTSESGVRGLEQNLAKIVRRVILERMRRKGETAAETVVVKPDALTDYLGVARYTKDRYEGNSFAGVVTGLAWTQVGGEILYIESSLSPSKNPVLELTGNLGNVMKESATIAYQWVKAHATSIGINPELFTKYTLNIHAPEGAIPKDGPSAGVTIVTSIVSTFRQVKVAPRTAMTGEITLRGRVLPVGGIKEKILAAKRAGITDIILSKDNRKDVSDINERYLSGLTFHYVETVNDVLKIAITDEPAECPLSL